MELREGVKNTQRGGAVNRCPPPKIATYHMYAPRNETTVQTSPKFGGEMHLDKFPKGRTLK